MCAQNNDMDEDTVTKDNFKQIKFGLSIEFYFLYKLCLTFKKIKFVIKKL